MSQIPMQSHSIPAQTMSLDFVKAYFITMRPYLLFVSGITAVVGLSFAADATLSAMVIVVAAGFFSYGFGQALTDCSQTDTDAISSPYRPLVQGRITKRQVMSASLAGLALIGFAYIWLEPRTIFLTLTATLGLATYTWFKRRWWGGPFWNSWIVAVLALVSYFAARGEVNFMDLPRNFTLALIAVFFGYANFVLTGYYKDIEADRPTGYQTLPVRFGYGISNIISDGFALIAAGATLAIVLSASEILALTSLPSWVACISGVSVSVLAQVRLHKVRRDEDAHLAIAPVVHAYILQLSAIVLSMNPLWWPMLTLYYIAYVLTMKVRPLTAQI